MFFDKEPKYNNFVPRNIFRKDQEGNSIYFQWGKLGKGYIVNDSEKQAHLVDLEGYKHFIFSYKPPIIIPIIMLAVFISSGLYFFTDYKIEIRDSVVSVTIILYSVVASLYMLKIRNVIKNCASISKDEKTWIFQNV